MTGVPSELLAAAVWHNLADEMPPSGVWFVVAWTQGERECVKGVSLLKRAGTEEVLNLYDWRGRPPDLFDPKKAWWATIQLPTWMR